LADWVDADKSRHLQLQPHSYFHTEATVHHIK